jgi:hypothetical protein
MSDRSDESDLNVLGRGRRRSARLVLVGLTLTGLLAVVSAASESGFGGDSGGVASADYRSWSFSAFLVLWVLAVPFTGWALYQQGAQAVRQRTPFRDVVVRKIFVALLCILIGGGVYLKRQVDGPVTAATVVRYSPSGATAATRNGKRVRAEPVFKWPVAVAAGLLLLIAGVPVSRAYLGERRRRQQRVAPPLSQRQQAAVDFERIAADLDAEPDTRRAIVAAYARMERVLASRGIGRQASETAREYLQRVVYELTGRAEPVERLTELFEVAKFSRGELSPTMKADAVVALQEIRNDLTSAADGYRDEGFVPHPSHRIAWHDVQPLG